MKKAQWRVEGGSFKFIKVGRYKTQKVPAWIATDGETSSQLTSVKSEAEFWVSSLNSDYRPAACQLS